MTTYTWDIQTVEILPNYGGKQNVVHRVVWICTAESATGETKSQTGVIELDINKPSDNFISANSLTKEQIINWVKELVAVKVVEDGLMPATQTISFVGVTDNNATLEDQLAAASENSEPAGE